MAEPNRAGRYWVKATKSALAEAIKLCPRVGDRMEIRRHALKLRFWPDSPPGGRGEVMELDWEWVKGISSNDVGELRIRDVIAGCDNLRIIFYVGGKRPGDASSIIWILRVFQKKRDDFSAGEIAGFRLNRKNVRIFYYGERAR